MVLTSFKLMLDFYGISMTLDDHRPEEEAGASVTASPSSLKREPISEDDIRLMSNVSQLSTREHVEGFVRTAAYRERYRNFENRPHNFLRMTRIIKCLGLCGLGKHQAPLCRFLLHEVEAGRLAKCMYSLRDYWIAVVLDDDERERLYAEAEVVILRVQERIRNQYLENQRKLQGERKQKWHPMDCVHSCGCTLQ